MTDSKNMHNFTADILCQKANSASFNRGHLCSRTYPACCPDEHLCICRSTTLMPTQQVLMCRQRPTKMHHLLVQLVSIQDSNCHMYGYKCTTCSDVWTRMTRETRKNNTEYNLDSVNITVYTNNRLKVLEYLQWTIYSICPNWANDHVF